MEKKSRLFLILSYLFAFLSLASFSICGGYDWYYYLVGEFAFYPILFIPVGILMVILTLVFLIRFLFGKPGKETKKNRFFPAYFLAIPFALNFMVPFVSGFGSRAYYRSYTTFTKEKWETYDSRYRFDLAVSYLKMNPVEGRPLKEIEEDLGVPHEIKLPYVSYSIGNPIHEGSMVFYDLRFTLDSSDVVIFYEFYPVD